MGKGVIRILSFEGRFLGGEGGRFEESSSKECTQGRGMAGGKMEGKLFDFGRKGFFGMRSFGSWEVGFPFIRGCCSYHKRSLSPHPYLFTFTEPWSSDQERKGELLLLLLYSFLYPLLPNAGAFLSTFFKNFFRLFLTETFFLSVFVERSCLKWQD